MALAVVVFAAYATGSWLAFGLLDASGLGAVLFVPAGVTVGALLSVTRDRWWVVLAAAAGAEIGVDLLMGLDTLSAAGFAMANVAGPLAGASLARRHRNERLDLHDRRDLWRFVSGAVVAGPVVAAMVGASMDRVLNADPWWATAWQWWLGDALGVLLVGGAIIAPHAGPDRVPLRWRPATAVLVAVAVLAIVTSPAGEYPLEFLLLSVIVIAGGIVGVRAAALAALSVAAALAVMILIRDELWFTETLPIGYAVVKAELGLFTLLGYALAAEASNRLLLERRRLRLEAAIDSLGDLPDLLDAVDEGFCVAETVEDDSGRVIDVRFVWANPRYEALFGVGSLVDRTLLEIRPDIDRVWLKRTERVANGERLLLEDIDIDGRWAEIVAVPLGAPGRVAFAVQDRTAEHDARRALIDSERRFRSIADDLPGIVWMYGPDGAPQWVNRAFCDYFDVDRAEVLAGSWLLPIHRDDSETLIQDFVHAVEARTVFSGTVRVRRADRTWRRLEFRSRPRFDDEGRYLGHLGTSVDITERIEAQELLAELLAAERAARQQAETLENLAATLAAAADVDSMASETLQILTRLGLRLTSIHVQRDQRLVLAAGTGIGDDDAAGDVASLAADVVESGTAVHISGPDLIGERYPSMAGDGERLDVGSILSVPIRTDEGVTGVVSAAHPDSDFFSGGNRGIFEAVADLLGGAIERAVLHDRLAADHVQESRRRKRAELIATILSEIEALPSLTERCRHMVERLVDDTVEWAIVERIEADEPEVVALAHRDPERREILQETRQDLRLPVDHPSSPNRVADERRRLVGGLRRVGIDGRRASHPSVEFPDDLDIDRRSFVIVPLPLGGQEPLSLLAGRTGAGQTPFDDEDLAFFDDLAGRIGVALTTAALHEQEHEISKRLQRALLPEQLVHHPDLNIAARYRTPATLLDVGGDWYDTYSWPDGTLGLVVGDVVGHGLEAAAAMGRLRAGLTAICAAGTSSPGELLDTLDRYLNGPAGARFATAFLLTIDPETGAGCYSSAGHPPALTIRADGSTEWLDQAQSPPLCSLDVPPRSEVEFSLKPGDTVVLYSDGLVERRGRAIDEGMSALATAAGSLAACHVDDLADHLVAMMTADRDAADDIVVLTAGLNPVADRFRTTIEADPTALAPLRTQLRDWLKRQRVTAEAGEEIVLAVGEAATNSVKHAYPQQSSGRIHIDLDRRDGIVTARVRDNGRWVPPTEKPTVGGRGRMVMKMLADRYREDWSNTGTAVHMEFDVDS